MTATTLLGWAGTAFFFSRFLVQWIVSERQGRSVAPVSFWWLSILGAAFMSTYMLLREEPVLFTGTAVNGAIYLRNWWIAGGRSRHLSPFPLAALALAASVILAWNGVLKARDDLTAAPLWLIFSVVGQTIWSTRFVVQWWFTERRGVSHFPRAFWWISLLGNVLLLAYAIHLRDAVFIAGFTPGPIVQIRNLILDSRPRPDGVSVEASR